MRVLGVDASSNTGLVSIDSDAPDEVLYSGELKAPKKPGQTLQKRLKQFRANFLIKLSQLQPDLVVMEDFAFMAKSGKDSIILNVGLGLAIRQCVEDRGTPIVLASPNTLKKFATGVGSGKKDQIMLGVFKRWGFEHKSNDVVDAFIAAKLGCTLVSPRPNDLMPKDCLDAFKGLTGVEDNLPVLHELASDPVKLIAKVSLTKA